jgi:hypothetical protein
MNLLTFQNSKDNYRIARLKATPTRSCYTATAPDCEPTKQNHPRQSIQARSVLEEPEAASAPCAVLYAAAL